MSVYVDNMLRAARVGNCRPARWSHLGVADTHEELEAFARQLGLSPSWLQKAGTVLEHYDVTATVRERALELGAIPMQYGREGGLFSMLKRARQSGDPESIARAEALLAEERTRLSGDVQSNG